MHGFFSSVLCALACCAGAAAHASPTADPYSADSGWQLGVATGLGQLANPLVQSHDIPLVLLPRLEFFYHDVAWVNTSLAYTPIQTDAGNLALVTQLNQDGLYFLPAWQRHTLAQWRVPPMAGPTPEFPGTAPEPNLTLLAKRHLSYLAGAEWTFQHEHWHLAATWLSDITAGHHGQEQWLRAEYYWQVSAWTATVGVELQRQNSQLLQYYYGVAADDVSAGFRPYHAGAAIHAAVKLHLQYAMTAQWSLLADVKHQQLGAAMRDSPLIGRSQLWSAFVGAAYAF